MSGMFPEKLPLPEDAPEASDPLVNAEGNVWLRQWKAPFGKGRIWTVLDRSGGYLGDIELPWAEGLFEVGWDSILGLGPYEEELVHLYPLERRPQAF